MIVAMIVLASLLVSTSMSAAHSGLATVSGARVRRKPAPGCAGKTFRTIAVSESAVVRQMRGGNEWVFGCSRGRRAYRLGFPHACDETGCVGVDKEILNGSIVAYEWERNTATNEEEYVIVRDLRTGKVLHAVPTGARLRPESGKVGVGRVTTMVVKSDGAVAWIAFDFERSPGPLAFRECQAKGIIECRLPKALEELKCYDVYETDKTGTQLLASSTKVDPDSLALAGSTLYWTQNGKPMSAVLN
jgi:hypothetical protein